MKTYNLVLQARVGSTRFPNKVLQPIGEYPTVIDFIFHRLKHIKEIDKFILAVPDTKENDVFEKYNNFLYEDKKFFVFRGSENNVLQRVYKSIECFCGVLQDQYVIDVTSDCPFVCPKQISTMINLCNKLDIDYISNVVTRCWPDGFDVQIYRADFLKHLDIVDIGKHKEHTGWNILNYSDLLRYRIKRPLNIMNYSPPFKYFKPEWAVTLDTSEDLEVIREIHNTIKNLPGGTYDGNDYPNDYIVELLLNNPAILNRNKHVIRKIPGV